MANFTQNEIYSLDIVGPAGPVTNFSTFSLDGLDVIGPMGILWAPNFITTPPEPASDFTKMFLIF